MKNIFVQGNDPSITEMFEDNGWTPVDEVGDADLVCFIGGSDVSPELYGHANSTSYVDVDMDLASVHLYTQATAHDLPCVGICRGGQFLHIMNGGVMEQHILDHLSDHSVYLSSDYKEIDGQSFMTSSDHHQGMVISGIEPDISTLGKAEDGTIEVVVHGGKGETFDLCFQGHPEYDWAVEAEDTFFSLINFYMEEE